MKALAARLGRPVHLFPESDLNTLVLPAPAGARRLRLRRPVDGRLPPLPPHPADRRAERLLPGLRRARPDGEGDGAAASSIPGSTPPSAGGATACRRAGWRPSRHVVCSQNHDQTGNRMLGRAARRAGRLREPEARGGRRAPLALPAAPVHGRGVRRDGPLPLLRGPFGPGAGSPPCARGARRSSPPSAGRRSRRTRRPRRPSRAAGWTTCRRESEAPRGAPRLLPGADPAAQERSRRSADLKKETSRPRRSRARG